MESQQRHKKKDTLVLDPYQQQPRPKTTVLLDSRDPIARTQRLSLPRTSGAALRSVTGRLSVFATDSPTGLLSPDSVFTKSYPGFLMMLCGFCYPSPRISVRKSSIRAQVLSQPYGHPSPLEDCSRSRGPGTFTQAPWWLRCRPVHFVQVLQDRLRYLYFS